MHQEDDREIILRFFFQFFELRAVEAVVGVVDRYQFDAVYHAGGEADVVREGFLNVGEALVSVGFVLEGFADIEAEFVVAGAEEYVVPGGEFFCRVEVGF